MAKDKDLRNDLAQTEATPDTAPRRADPDRDAETSAVRESTTWQDRDARREVSSQDGGDQDDVIKVDTAEVLTPNERSAGILSRLTRADAQTARRELTARRFDARLENEFHTFCTAYGLADSRAARGQFVAFLGQAGLAGKRTITTAEQASTAAKSVFFAQVAAGAKVSRDTVGARDVLDPRIALTDEERAQLRGITLADGKNALDERTAAEEAWQTKQYQTVLDAKAIYASGTPHLAAFQMAARNAGYTDAEIAMVAEGKDKTWLWHYTRKVVGIGESPLAEMPATYKDFVALFGKAPLQRDTLDCNQLEDARLAIAAGQTLAQFYADPERGAAYFQAPARDGMQGPEVLPDIRKMKLLPIGYCEAGSATLAAATVGFIHCTTNGKYYVSGGFTTAMGLALSGQRLAVWGVEGASIDDVITGPSLGAEGSFGEGLSVGGVIMGNHSGIVVGGSGSLGVTIPAGVSFSETYDLRSGKVPLISSTYESVEGGMTELTFGGNGRGQIEDTLRLWPAGNQHGHGLYNFLTGNADSNLHDFTTNLPSKLEGTWNASAEKQAVEQLVASRGGVAAVSRAKQWGELVPEMKALALRFFDREVRNYIAR